MKLAGIGQLECLELTRDSSHAALTGQALGFSRIQLSTRTHRRGKCLLVLDRDWNAAINILELALRTVGHTGSNASEENDLCAGDSLRGT